ncbi:kinase-like domain-containing protein [Cyathus striatus]|nr:kinase-like domain-containing protein [Cyathus striatus]
MDLSSILQPGGDDVDIDWWGFWFSEQTRAWFLQRGYRLFSRDDDFENKTPSDTFRFHQSSYPYPYHSKNLVPENLISFRVYCTGAVAYGQDSMLHPIVIKCIRGNSEEYKCLQFIKSLDLNQTRESCIIPVLEFLQYDEHWFAVMPQWTEMIPVYNCTKLKDVLGLIHAMLTAVNFLHERRIFHRDIKTANLVVNFLPTKDHSSYDLDKTYLSLQSCNQLLYAIIDFGLSIKFPKNFSSQQCRLPYSESWCGTFSVPADCMQGEFDFDPFAFDVGTLGCVFADKFKHLIPLAPMLAPLIDKMVTRDIRNRFTATQALHFFEEMRTELTEKQLLTHIDISASASLPVHYEIYDRWAGLPSDFIEKWSKYREPPVPRSMKFLRAICLFHPKIYHSVATIRKTLHSIIS